MSRNHPFTIETFPSSRQFTFDVGQISRRKHHVFAMLEIDVSEPLARLRELKRQDSSHGGSFTGWFIKCLGDAVLEHPQVHALRKGKNQLLIFDEVDISTLVEKVVQGKNVPLPVVIRDVGKKTLSEVQAEMTGARERRVFDESGYVLSEERSRWGMRFFTSLPQWIRLLVWGAMLRNPQRQKEMMGTVVVTSIGMMGRAGWIVPSSMLPLSVALGSISQKPGIHRGQIAIRDYLPVTVVIDHDIIDGAPAARFVSRLAELVESGHLLGV